MKCKFAVGFNAHGMPKFYCVKHKAGKYGVLQQKCLSVLLEDKKWQIALLELLKE